MPRPLSLDRTVVTTGSLKTSPFLHPVGSIAPCMGFIVAVDMLQWPMDRSSREDGGTGAAQTEDVELCPAP